MTGELFHDHLAQETAWFMENAERVERIPEPRVVVRRLLEIAEARGLHFRNTVLLASTWILDNGQRAPRKKVALFYVRWFERQTAPAPQQFKPEPVAIPFSLGSWIKGMPDG